MTDYSQSSLFGGAQRNKILLPISIFYLDYLSRWTGIFEQTVAPKLKINESACMHLKTVVHGNADSTEVSNKASHEHLKHAVAIIGLSCRFAGANSVAEFWELMLNGVDAINKFPSERLSSGFDDHVKTIGGFLKCPIDEFDAKFFGISPREAEIMDPQQRLLTEVAWEAFENAAVNMKLLKGSNTAVYTGIWTKLYEKHVEENNIDADFHNIILGNAFSATSARISYALGLNGPNIATESGCSSSMVSLHLACESLKRRETDMALVGGVHLLLEPFHQEKMLIVSNDGHCRTFDAQADGFGRAEGCAAIVLKRYSDAVKDGDNIRAIILGTGISSEGTSTSFGTPSISCQEIAIRDAFKSAKIDPRTVDYVEAHGTGTPVGDPIEFQAIASVYAGRMENQPLVIGSVKTNIGHSEAASGLAGIIKVILSMKNEYIPSHINFESLNPLIRLESIPAVIPVSGCVWPKLNGKNRLAGVSSFGISGTNVHVIIQEPPPVTKFKSTIESREQHILTLSAKSEKALSELIQTYIVYLDSSPDLGSLAFTVNTSKVQFNHRLAVIGKDSSEVKQRLLRGEATVGISSANKPKVAFLFTGQGCQYINMGKVLYRTYPIFKREFDKCNTSIKHHLNIDIGHLLWSTSADNLILEKTINSQLSIFCIEYGLLKLWNSFGVHPDIVLGHSAGEFAAAVAAGVLSLESAVMLVAQRSRLIQGIAAGKMLVIQLSKTDVQTLLRRFHEENPNLWLDIAVVNHSRQVVVAGSPDSVSRISEMCSFQGIKTHMLASTHAFHSREMDKILNEFKVVATQIMYNAPTCTYISSFSGTTINHFSSTYWLQHTRESVNFPAAVDLLQKEGCQIFLEIGPQPVLLSLVSSNLNSDIASEFKFLPSIRKTEYEWVTLLSSLSNLYTIGIDIDWKSFDSPYNWQKVETPTYQFQRQKYWLKPRPRSTFLLQTLHPLLGNKLSTVLENHIYYNSIDLNRLFYLKDHQIADSIIFPGAGYLEIILAAAQHSIHGISGKQHVPSDIVVQNLIIEAPLLLEVGQDCNIQIVASPTEGSNSGTVSFKIYKSSDDGNRWKCHAEAVATLLLTNEQNRDTGSNITDIMSRCENEITGAALYQRSLEQGYGFGGAFQSITYVWMGANELLAEISVPTEFKQLQDYVYHPIILDALIQAFSLNIDENHNIVYLPVAIGRFHSIAVHDTSIQLFAHATWQSGKTSGDVILYNESGTTLAKMSQIRVAPTSKTAFADVIKSQQNTMPSMFKECWQASFGPMECRLDLAETPSCRNELNLGIAVNLELIEAYKSQIIGGKFEWIHKLCGYLVLRGLLVLGWKPRIGERVDVNSIIVNLNIEPKHQRFMCRILEILQEDGILCVKNSEKSTKQVWVIMSSISFDEVESAIKDYKNRLNVDEQWELMLLDHSSKQLIQVLQGYQASDGMNFIEDKNSDPGVAKWYSETIANKLGNSRIKECLKNFLWKSSGCKSSAAVVRILEIGAGTSELTDNLTEMLQKLQVPFMYTFTNTSEHVLTQAGKKYSKADFIDCMFLDIESDPKLQGFVPHQYDIIVASNILHRKKYITESVHNIRHLLRSSGVLILQDIFKPIRYIDIMFGYLESYWGFQDVDLRPLHPMMSYNKWESVLTNFGFTSALVSEAEEINSVIFARAGSQNPAYSAPLVLTNRTEKRCWILFINAESSVEQYIKSSLKTCGEHVVTIYSGTQYQKVDTNCYRVNPKECLEIINILELVATEYRSLNVFYFWGMCGNFEQDVMCANFLQVTQYMLRSSKFLALGLFLVTRGVYYIGDQITGDSNTSTLWGIFRAAVNENHNLLGSAIDLNPEKSDPVLEGNQIFSQLWLKDSEFQVAFRNNKRYFLRITPIDTKSTTSLNIPNGGRYCLRIPATRAINDVTLESTTKCVLESNDVELVVKAVSLNFRDPLVIIKPEKYHTLSETVGTDFAGIVTAVGCNVNTFQPGDKVFGMSLKNTAVASHVVVKFNTILHKPHNFTFTEASAIPTVFLTAFHCLHYVANLMKGQTVLIHVASGGVGLTAIQIAKYIGANVIATAGSKRKRGFLKSIGIHHVFPSRDTMFGEKIKNVTSGVDVVLNSLTGPNFKETSLSVCNHNAHFIEIGKVNIWNEDELKNLRPDVKYTIVDLEKVPVEQMNNLMKDMQESIILGNIAPLPCTRFDISLSHVALNYLLSTHHIGKIVLTTPEMKMVNGKTQFHQQLFNSESTYLVTGGLGGIGFEMTKWMLTRGAKYIVLVSRHSPDQERLSGLKVLNQSSSVITMKVDIGDMTKCMELFKTLKANQIFPPLRGIFHAAGTLSDGTIVNQTWEKFQQVFNAKVHGSWNLHLLTRNMNLEYFVMFSSVTSVLGFPGQSNHAAGNMFMDSLVHYRESMGLTAQTINWGAWSEIGVARDIARFKTGETGIIPLSAAQGIAALEYILSHNKTQTIVSDMNPHSVSDKYRCSKQYFGELLSCSPIERSDKGKIESSTFWKEIVLLTKEERFDYFRNLLEYIIHTILKLPPSEAIDPLQAFSDLGIDSLMAVEMRNSIQEIMGKRLTINSVALMDYPTVNELKTHLTELTLTLDINSMGAISTDTNVTDSFKTFDIQDSYELVKKDSSLPVHIKDVGGCVKPSYVRNVLLTGSTGTLGPYILNELNNLGYLNIYCLVRGKNSEIAREKVMSSLKKCNSLYKVRLDKISIVLGDIAKTNLGLSESDYKRLAATIDAIINCAVKTNHVESYKEHTTRNDIRSVNALGVLHVLEFASTIRTKLVLHSSSISAINEVTEDGFLSDNCISANNYGEGIEMGYSLSKIVGEKLCAEAINRGIPCSILRYSSLTGDSKSGSFSTDSDHFTALVLTCLRLGVTPEFQGCWNVIPVDTAAVISLRIFFNDNAEIGVYNVTNSEPLTWDVFIKTAHGFGKQIRTVEQSEFFSIIQSEGPNCLLFPFISLYSPSASSLPVKSTAFLLSDDRKVFRFNEKISTAVPGIAEMILSPSNILSLLIQYGIDSGIFRSLGINL